VQKSKRKTDRLRPGSQTHRTPRHRHSVDIVATRTPRPVRFESFALPLGRRSHRLPARAPADHARGRYPPDPGDDILASPRLASRRGPPTSPPCADVEGWGRVPAAAGCCPAELRSSAPRLRSSARAYKNGCLGPHHSNTRTEERRIRSATVRDEGILVCISSQQDPRGERRCPSSRCAPPASPLPFPIYGYLPCLIL
jgi:hypothetical protein